jgi:hypothetical protein
MPNPQHGRRLDVLAAASKGAWALVHAAYDSGNILVDTFTSHHGIVRVVWLRTPWSDTGRFAGALFSDPAAKKDRNVWKVSGHDGLLALLAGVAR